MSDVPSRKLHPANFGTTYEYVHKNRGEALGLVQVFGRWDKMVLTLTRYD